VLGSELAAQRRLAGLSQAQVAQLINYSRSTIANVEIGRQHVPGRFWASVDTALNAGGVLIAASEELEEAARRDSADAIRVGRVAALMRTTPANPAQAAPGAGGIALAEISGTGPDVVAMAAAQARLHAQHAAVTEVGPGTLEQLTADVIRLGRAYVSGPPVPLFAAMRHTLSEVQAALNARAYPSQARDLTFLTGAMCALMANASLDLGRQDSADDLARAAWTYGKIIEHSALMGWACGTQALAAIWDGRFADAAGHAEDGLAHVHTGMGAVRLHAIRARALAAGRDFKLARAALEAAASATSSQEPDTLHNGIAGEFAFDEAKLRYYDSLVLVAAGHPAQAEAAAASAVGMYEAVPGRSRSYGCLALARVQLATARLMNGKLEEAAEAIQGLMALDPSRRISSLHHHLAGSKDLLRGSAYRNSHTARQLEQQLRVFTTTGNAVALPTGQ
jgi:transcriptional regulator with XRE-family HTH domain